MKLLVKTLKGAKFNVEVDGKSTVAQVKTAIEGQKSELPAATMKLIHSGKVLKDDDSIESCGIKEKDFLVVMVTKPKKAAAAPKVDTKATAEVSPMDTTPTAAAAAPAASTPAPAATADTPAAPDRATDTIPEEAVTNLTAMGFPEAEVRHCLRAAHGNPDIAVEFLTNGIPDGVAAAANFVNATSSSSGTPAPNRSTAGGGGPLQALRNHPQFDALRRLVQGNPAALQQVLTQIGQQQPDLLAAINANQGAFLEMMNEPITAAPTGGTGATAGAGGGANPMALDPGNPAQMAQMIQNMSEAEIAQVATMMGLTPEQLRQTAQMIGQLPAEQLQQFMMHARGAGGGGGGAPDGAQVLRLTEEEMAAVGRLTDMGFDRSEAVQAFLACDKNEALAANLLMDSMGSGGMFGDGGGGGAPGSSGGGAGGGANDDDDNMYD